MLKVAIVEDEVDAQELLHDILTTYCHDIEVVGVVGDRQSAVDLLQSTDPDLVFLDIQLKGCTAFELLGELSSKEFDIVITTAYDQYAIDAFGVDAVHYLLKPIAPKDVLEALDRVKRKILSKDTITQLAQSLHGSHNDQKLALSTAEGIIMVDPKDVVRVQAARAYSDIILADGRCILISKPLAEIEAKLHADRFYRVHTSHIVNMDHILKVLRQDGGEIHLSNGDRVPISRRRKQDLLKRLFI